jgi:hypothetical protein
VQFVQIYWASSSVSAGILPPPNDDSRLPREFVAHYFSQPTVKAIDAKPLQLNKYFHSDWLRSLLAETKVLLNGARVGQSDAKEYEAYVKELGAVRSVELKNQVEIEFSQRNQKFWQVADDVKLQLTVKNVPRTCVAEPAVGEGKGKRVNRRVCAVRGVSSFVGEAVSNQ